MISNRRSNWYWLSSSTKGVASSKLKHRVVLRRDFALSHDSGKSEF